MSSPAALRGVRPHAIFIAHNRPIKLTFIERLRTTKLTHGQTLTDPGKCLIAHQNMYLCREAMPVFCCPVLLIKQTEQALAGFASLLQHGMVVHVDRPVALVPFLLDLPGFSEEYIEKTVQTVFIDGVAADSLDRALPPGTTLALSAAMPGLAGAIFRRQGLHGSLRSHTQEKPADPMGQSGYITLKLFNMIAADRIRDLLRHGICVTGASFVAFAAHREALLQPPAVLVLDHKPVSLGELLQAAATHPFLAVRVVLLAG